MTVPSSLPWASGMSSTDWSGTVTAVLRASAGVVATMASRETAMSFFMESSWVEMTG